MNYYQLLKDWAGRQPDKLFLAVDDVAWSYRDLLEETDRLADNMKRYENKLRQGGGVLVLADTPAGQLLGFLAAQALSVRPILLHHGLPEQEVLAILRENRLSGLLTLTGQSKTCAIHSFCAPSSYKANKAKENPADDEALARPGTADILGVLSSGSMGTPKVMYRTYDSWAGFFPVQNPIFHVSRETRLFLQGSLSFTGNLNSLLSVLYAGGSIITSAHMHCRQWALQMEQYHVNVIYLIPAKLQLFAAAVKQQLPQVCSLFTGSQLLSARNIRDLKRLLPQAALILYYGASELNYITYAVCDDPDRDSRNLGRPFPGIGVTVKDGLIYVDTPYHVSGAKIPFTVRDMGGLNEKGELIFEGRREAWVNKGGYKINTLQLENELLAIAGICDAVVLPCRDALRGTALAAFVVREPSAGMQIVRAAIRHALKPTEVPDIIRFLPHIPLNDRGKADRHSLLAMLDEQKI